MSVECAHVEEDWELFVLGSLEEAAQQRMASHVRSGCKECHSRLMEAQIAAGLVAMTAPERQPSLRVERDLLKRIEAGESSGWRSAASAWSWPRFRMIPWVVATACVLLAGWFFWQQRRLGEELTKAEATIERMRRPGTATGQGAHRVAEVPNGESTDSATSTTTSSSAKNAFASNESPADRRAARNQDVDNRASGRAEDERKLANDGMGKPFASTVAELAAQVDELKKENAGLRSATAAAEKNEVELQGALSASTARAEALERDLEAVKISSGAANPAEVATLNRQLLESSAEVARLGAATARYAQIENLLQSGSTQQIVLRVVDPAGGKAFARVFYSPQAGLLLLADALPKLDHEKCYQLWVIRKGAPAILSAGLLQTSDDGHGFLFAEPTRELAELTGLAITDEPKGGSISARGHKLLFGAR